MQTDKISLSVNKIAQLEVVPGRSQTIYWDAKTPNLGLRVTRTDNKSFIFEASLNDSTV